MVTGRLRASSWPVALWRTTVYWPAPTSRKANLPSTTGTVAMVLPVASSRTALTADDAPAGATPQTVFGPKPCAPTGTLDEREGRGKDEAERLLHRLLPHLQARGGGSPACEST